MPVQISRWLWRRLPSFTQNARLPNVPPQTPQRGTPMENTSGLPWTISATAGAALLSFGLMVYSPGAAQADPNDYTFTRLATVPGPVPGQATQTFDLDFEPHAINAAGNVAFAADLKADTDIGEGVFASSSGRLLQTMTPGDPAPGGENFLSSSETGVLGMTPLNNFDDGAFVYILNTWDPKTQPIGLNAGLYRFSRTIPKPSAVVV